MLDTNLKIILLPNTKHQKLTEENQINSKNHAPPLKYWLIMNLMETHDNSKCKVGMNKPRFFSINYFLK